jgi:endonuclease/exonuclease/phosphatase (EEP) superfamily protein YafD
MTLDVVNKSPPRSRRALAVLCWGYLLLLVGFVILVRTFGDQKWQVTLLAFSPRWVALLPLGLLVPLAMGLHRRMLLVLGVAAVVAIFPLMGFCISYQHFKPAPAAGLPIRVLAFNCHHDYLSGEGFSEYLHRVNPDVVSLEELPTDYDHRLLPRSIWNVVQHDELCVASKYPIISAHDIWRNAITKFGLLTPAGRVDFISVHLSSPRYALRDTVKGEEHGARDLMLNIRSRSGQASDLQRTAASADHPLIIAGDFNLVPDSTLLLGKFPSMTDCFEATGLGFGWTYSNGLTIVRIDRVLSNSSFVSLGFQRGPKFKSPHVPIVADLVLKSN